MARYRGPMKKYLRRFGMISEEENPEKLSRAKRKSDFGKRLEEKQRLKFMYGLMEKQFRRYVQEAKKFSGEPGEKLWQILETRLDNVVYLLGFARSRRQARQYVNHGHVLVNGARITIPSYQVKVKDLITLRQYLYDSSSWKEQANARPSEIPVWLKKEDNKGQVEFLPTKEMLPRDLNISAILELYS